jgi:hypothetical protein
VDCSASLQKDIREQAATIAGHISRAKSSPIESMTTYWKVDRNQKLFLIMCSHASFRSNVAVNRLCSPSLKVPVEAPYDHLNKAPTSLDELLPRCQLCARTCGSVHAPPSNAPQIPPSKINRVFSHVKAESSNCSLQANAAGLQVLQVDSDCDESEPGAAEHTSAPARGITDVLNKRAKVHHSDGQDVASHRTGISSSSDVTAAYFLTYRMLCKFPESQVVSFLRRMKQLERVGHVAKIEGKKSSQDLQEFSSDEEILCNVPESCHDPDSGDKNTWLHHDVRTILEQGASKSSHRQHASRQSYIEPKLVPIPTIIKHLEPQLSVAAFNKIMATDDFNNKRVRICRICHARYSSFVLSSRIERINELVATSKGMNSALKLPLANIRSHAPSASLSARAHAPAPKASIRPALSQRSEFSARQQNIDALRCNGQTVRGVRLMLNELHVPFDESSQSSSASYSDDFDEDSESSLNEDGIDSEVKPLHVALPAVRHLFRHMSGSEWPQASDHAVNSSLATGSRDTDQSLTFAKWMNFCKTFSVTERLPVQKQDCIDCFKDANLGSLQRSMSLLQFSACLLHMAVKSGILSHSDIRPSILDKNLGLQTLAAKPNDFSSRISSAIELIKSKRDGPSVSSALASLFPSQDENVSNSARSVMATQRSRTIDLIAVKSTGRTISSDQQPQPLPSVQTAFKDKEKFTVESKSAMRDKLYSGKAHLRRLRYNSAVCCPNVLLGIAQLLRMLHIVGTDTSAYCDTVQMNVYESPPLWRLQPVFCKLFQDASMSSHNMISNMGSRQKTLNLGEWSVWCSERKVCDHLNMRKSDAISCFLMAGGNVTGCEVDLEGFCACFIQMAVLAGFLRADQLIDFINPLVESDVSRTNAQFGIDISPSRDRHLVGTESDPRSGALWDRLPAIRVWFKQAASEGGVSFGNRGNLVSLQEWQSFCRKIGFASLGLSRSDLTYAFVNGFSPDNSESSVRQDIYEARISEFSQSIILIAVRARFIVVEPCCSAPSAINCDENTLENVRRMFARLSIPVSGAGLPLISSDSESLQLPKKSVFHMHFKQYLSRTFDSRDQCSLDQLSFSLPDMLPCLGKTFNDLSCQMPPVSVSLMSPAAGFETTQFWIKFCLQSLAADVLHLKLVDAVTCVIAADPAASQYRRSQPMTLELFSQCLLHLAQRSKFLLKQDADALPRATKCSGCSILAVAFMLISLKQAPEALSTETYLKILAANASAGIDPVNSNDNLTIVAPKNTQEVLDKLLQQQPSTTAWPAEDRHDIKVALQKEEASRSAFPPHMHTSH